MVSYLTIDESDRNMGAPAVLDFWEFPKSRAPRCCFRHLYAGMYVIDPWHVKNTTKNFLLMASVHIVRAERTLVSTWTRQKQADNDAVKAEFVSLTTYRIIIK